MSDTTPDNAFSLLLIALFKGVLYREDDAAQWQQLLDRQAAARDYLGVIGLELILDEAEGYAYPRSAPTRRQCPAAAGSAAPAQLPSEPVAGIAAQAGRSGCRWRRTADPVARTARRDAAPVPARAATKPAGRSHRRARRQDCRARLPAQAARGTNRYEVRRILKAFVDAQWLNEFDQRLGEYAGQHGTEEQP